MTPTLGAGVDSSASARPNVAVEYGRSAGQFPDVRDSAGEADGAVADQGDGGQLRKDPPAGADVLAVDGDAQGEADAGVAEGQGGLGGDDRSGLEGGLQQKDRGDSAQG